MMQGICQHPPPIGVVWTRMVLHGEQGPKHPPLQKKVAQRKVIGTSTFGYPNFQVDRPKCECHIHPVEV